MGSYITTKMKELNLTQGQKAIVDDNCFDYVSQRKWRVNKKKTDKTYYAISGNSKVVKLHQEIWKYCNGSIPDGMIIDHANHNGLDCRLENLRLATPSQNKWNTVLPKHNSSGYKGVSARSDCNSFECRIKVNGKLLYLGSFKTALEAALAYDLAALSYFGEFALTNKMLGLIPL
jgi:hypothetical protein